MRWWLHDSLALIAILGGVIGASASQSLWSEWTVKREGSPASAEVIRVVDVEASGAVMLSRFGGPTVDVDLGTEISIDRANFEGVFGTRFGHGPIALELEFLHDGSVVGTARISSPWPRVIVTPHRFGVRGL